MRLANDKARRLGLLLLGLSLLGAASRAAAQWVEARPAGEGYRAEFPAKPAASVQEVKTEVGAIRVYMNSVSWNGLEFLTIYNQYPNQAPAERRLDGARDGAVKNVNGTLRQEQALTVGGAPARRIIVDVPNPRVVAVQLLVVRENKLYQAIVVGPVGSESSPEATRFVNSFALDPL